MDFLFAPDEKVEYDQLVQGDLLIRGQELTSVLAQAHQYYATAETYTHFVVITQSCDLVRRGKKPPKARYITIAAVRPLQIVIERHFAKLAFLWQGNDSLGIYDITKRELAAQFLERLLNNEEKNFFFFKAGSHPSIKEDLVAFLPLSVALKAEHYDALLKSKVAQLEPVFAAKLGWLVGNQYSRVATPDLEERGLKEEKEEFLADKLAGQWVSGARWKELGKRLKGAKAADANFKVTAETAAELLSGVPDEMELLASRAVEIIAKSGHAPGADELEEIRRLLMNDATLRSLAKGVR